MVKGQEAVYQSTAAALIVCRSRGVLGQENYYTLTSLYIAKMYYG